MHGRSEPLRRHEFLNDGADQHCAVCCTPRFSRRKTRQRYPPDPRTITRAGRHRRLHARRLYHADATTRHIAALAAAARNFVSLAGAQPVQRATDTTLRHGSAVCYTTVTSPIRKFNDYLLQRALKAKLRGERAESFSAQLIAQIQDCSDRARQASNLAQQWLDCEYLQQLHQQNPTQIYRAEIVHVTSSGIVVAACSKTAFKAWSIPVT